MRTRCAGTQMVSGRYNEQFHSFRLAFSEGFQARESRSVVVLLRFTRGLQLLVFSQYRLPLKSGRGNGVPKKRTNIPVSGNVSSLGAGASNARPRLLKTIGSGT